MERALFVPFNSSTSTLCPLYLTMPLGTASTKSTTTAKTTVTTVKTTVSKLTPSTTTKPTTSKPSTTSSTSSSSKFTSSTLKNNQLSQCSNYMLITDETRRSTHAHYIGCDNAIFKGEPKWVRFSGAAGTRLAPGPMEPFHCGTQGTGWYKGTYPTVAGTTTTGTVCYSWPGNMCMWSNQVSITRCNDFYVFALRAPPACYLRYCTV